MLQLPPIHYIDATAQEEASTTLRLLLMFSFASSSSPDIQGLRLLGGGEINLALMKDLVKVCFLFTFPSLPFDSARCHGMN